MVVLGATTHAFLRLLVSAIFLLTGYCDEYVIGYCDEGVFLLLSW